MPSNFDMAARRREVVGICLKVFTEKGLSVNTKELSFALNMQNAAIFYYFDTKDELIIACAEEAAFRLEEKLIAPLIKELDKPDEMMDKLQKKADEMAPLMRFLASAFTSPKYHEKLLPTLSKISERYKHYAENFAKALNVPIEQIEPYVYIGITAATNYMIFGDNSFIKPQFDLIKEKIIDLL